VNRTIVIALCFSVGCGDNTAVPNQPADDGGAADARVDAPVSCDPATDPSCVDEKQGLFVDAAKGTDGAEGTKAAPIKSISAALGKLGSKTRIYVCDGSYPGTLALKTSVAIYGGFACADWKAGGGKVTIVGDAEYGVDISAANVTLSDVEVQAPASTEQSVNSIAARVVGVDGVVFRRTKLVAKDGFNGATGTLTAFTTFPTQADLDGASSTSAAGGDKPAVSCPGGKTTKGGKGGDNGFNGDTGAPAGLGGAGGTDVQCGGTGQGGFPGMPGPAPVAALGAAVLGVVKDGKWQPQAGQSGLTGNPGGGGGGGAGRGGGGGGQGGAGGCGGAGGGGGGGGGASIALLVVNAGVSLASSTLTATKGGDGGSGVAGQSGQTPGGTRGVAAVAGTGCNGGAGGAGGEGGGGAGGAGGLSAGIVYVGKAPVATETTTSKGAGGGAGKGAASNDGIPGDAKDVYEAK
jgi:hypothetical protein